ncbi:MULTISPECIES: phage integrase central domain-containing protein [unclassified Burkholderia]|uniref:tyrosine-type recombinase/integrase n=1 Tax=unclassified Burkholderia TaxID=2613784 RepID=UPI000F582C36|nr:MULTISPECIES: integrase arm-type DNA-binding domain-containing protein [unclassified Burkholderia]RQR73755.1 DUF4102 domain-containing protein [Burkholderia sp. Bp9011]RQR92811.1 DUF4102 domain-containing protein [Burkholderia sp. Bp9010]RQS67804.1 DUF4102 domain-containing protein [Burkholderia sp. Bp8977]
MALTDILIRNARPGEKPQKLFDGGGLFLYVTPGGGKLWRLKYRFGGKEKLLALGAYPAVSLKDARERRDDARRQLEKDEDPGENRKADKAAKLARAANSFEAIGREWFARFAPTWAESHSSKIIQRLEKDVFPWLGARPVAEITAPELLTVLRRIENRGALDTALRAKQNCGQIFRYAVASGRAERDPSGDLRGALAPVRRENFPAITDPHQVAELLRAMEAFRGTFVVKCALQLAPMLFVRPGELRTAEWTALDLDRAEWRYLVTKTRTEHLVPLPGQAVALLRELHALTGKGRYVFPGRDPHKPMSGAAVNAALRRLGYDTKSEITGHGFRAMARTILHEELHFKPEVIEHQLAHKVPDALGTAYNRTRFLTERRAMMQQWADYLDRLKGGARIVAGKFGAAG